jgi:VIT1/CCC1 family predicted Fe2+/Mn2+ transporter
MDEPTTQRERILNPVDRVSEVVFGLLMAVSFTGAIDVASGGASDVRTVLFAAIACNLAWGLVDAVMYLVRIQVDKGHGISLMRAIRDERDPGRANAQIRQAFPGQIAESLPEDVVDGLRRHLLELPDPPRRPPIERRDLVAAVAIFVVVVLTTFPVVLPFVFVDELRLAMRVSNGIAVAMLFVAGLTLGRYAGTGALRIGLWMVALGASLIAVIIALGA